MPDPQDDCLSLPAQRADVQNPQKKREEEEEGLSARIIPILNPDGTVWKYLSRPDAADFISGTETIYDPEKPDTIRFQDDQGHYTVLLVGTTATRSRQALKDAGMEFVEYMRGLKERYPVGSMYPTSLEEAKMSSSQLSKVTGHTHPC
ncbi:uncharacterized protein I303_105610 [Kwoniella dejecticola CBS 10117]|uniref:Uncharacterized protein n=1 Tax=Kwoniella dejecticola CBS 10117 TaxID=1296121 RepID=A0A1A6A1Z7_9TREE|nr:uncharacterized protein I303_04947 [Kwoniella dejecticola CBS 10117]OBR84090.1 hypothetical protein I303_04947 [Kwoniella dejecticola CBS 10117]